MDYIIPTWLIWVIVSALAIGAIIIGAALLLLLSFWRRKGSHQGNQ